MKRCKPKFSDIGIMIGDLMIAAALIIFAVTQFTQFSARKKLAQTLEDIRSVMPEIYDTVPDDRIDMTMPALIIYNTRFCALIDVPSYGRTLPVRETWKRSAVASCPCRFTGTVYDGSLIIGGSDTEGQFDFIGKISIGERVSVIDFAGGRYNYKVSDIRKTGDVSYEHLISYEGDLVLFAKNANAFDYTVVICEFN